MIPAPFDYELDQFLQGPDLSKRLDVDLVFSSPFDEFWEENKEFIEPPCLIADHPIHKESEIVDGIHYRITDSGILMTDRKHEPIGAYVWSSLCLTKKWQGKGLGRELVIVRCTLDEVNPVWNLDVPAYSPAGLACHTAAWHHVRNLYA